MLVHQIKVYTVCRSYYAVLENCLATFLAIWNENKYILRIILNKATIGVYPVASIPSMFSFKLYLI